MAMLGATARVSLVSLCWFAAVYFYCRGFLLTRTALSSRSRCADVHHFAQRRGGDTVCWLPPTYSKAVVLLVDALRYDFVEWHEPAAAADAPYRNRVRVVHELLSAGGGRALLAPFTADPPTTTLQRLKGLTTGSLPTFIDAGSNFAGAEVTEDNWLDQLVALRRNIVFMGDDTWTALYPGRFVRSYPFASFDVKDLHTVDNGILSHIYDELAKDDWSVLIAHFLGVDHAGHKYGPNHAEMGKKLAQMNDVIANVTRQLDESTVLFVLGDHGMTATGDHGGDSDNELRSALFVYAKGPAPLHDSLQNIVPPVAQVDLVPTLSLLLDSPIPFSSLGSYIPTLFTADKLKTAAAKANVAQVLRYADEYVATLSKSTGGSDAGGLQSRLTPVLRLLHSTDLDDIGAEGAATRVRHIQGIFRDSWAKFHSGWMAIGLCAMVETLLWTGRLATLGDAMRHRRLVLKLTSVAMQALAVAAQIEAVPPALALLLLAQIFVDSVALLLHAFDYGTRWSWLSALCFALAGMHALSFFSNSYAINEHSVSRFLSATLVLVLFCQICTERVQQTLGQLRRAPAKVARSCRLAFGQCVGWRPPLYCAAMLTCVAASQLFTRCREELHKCVQSSSTLSFGALGDDTTLKCARLLIAIASLWCLVALTGRFLSANGHLVGDGAAQSLLKLLPRFSAAMTSFYWLGQCLPERFLSQHSLLLEFVPPASVYVAALLFTCCYCAEPLISSVQGAGLANGGGRKAVLDRAIDATDKRALFNHVKDNWSTYLSSGPHRIYGLATCYSGSVAALCSVWLPVFALLLGDGVAPALLPLLLLLVGTLEMFALATAGERAEWRAALWPCAVCWSLVSSHWFYGTGHAAAFAAIPWHAAFVGLPGNFRFQAAQAALVALNAYCAHVLCAIAAPLLVAWPAYGGKLGALAMAPARDNRSDRPHTTEWHLLADKAATVDKVLTVSLAYLTMAGLKLTCATAACALHRRHLMLWKIFAPKFIFEGLSFIATCLFLIVANWIVGRINAPKEKVVMGR